MKRNAASMIIGATLWLIVSFLPMSNIALASVSDLNLKLPFPGGESWGTTCAYQDTDSECTTHKAGIKDEWAIDFNLSKDDDCGESVVAAASGIASVYYSTTGYGNRVDISHGNNYMSRYPHFQSINVTNGEYVVQGQEIGKAGSTGRATNCHLHFVLYYNDGSGQWSVKPTPMSNYTEFVHNGGPYLSNNYFTQSTSFTFKNHSPQSWTTGFDTKTVGQTQKDIDTWMVAADDFDNTGGCNPGVVSPTFPQGINTKQFKQLKFSARVDGVGPDSPGYVWVNDGSGRPDQWNHGINFSDVPRDYKYHEYTVNLAELGDNLTISQFSLELTEYGSYEHWIFHWVKLISSYNQWEFNTSPEGWEVENGSSENIYDGKFWQLELKDNSLNGDGIKIISPYLGSVTASEYPLLEIRFSAKGDGKMGLAKVYVESENTSFRELAGSEDDPYCKKFKFTKDGNQHSYRLDMRKLTTAWHGQIYRLRFDPVEHDRGDEPDKVHINFIRLLKETGSPDTSPDDSNFIIVMSQNDEEYVNPLPSEHYTLNRSITCNYVDPNSPYNPSGEKTVFYNNDSSVYAWLQLDNVDKPLTIKWQWYNPDNSLAYSYTHITDDPKDSGYTYWSWYKLWSWLDISYVKNYGQWRVDFYIDEIKVIADYFTVTIDLKAPTGLTADEITASSVKLSWRIVENAEGYKIYRDGVYLNQTNLNQFADNGVNPNTIYRYQVAAVSGNASSVLSSALTITAIKSDTSQPNAPSELRIISP